MKVAELSTITDTFETIKNRAESRWQQLWNSGNPVIMVGTATCGRAAGALEVVQAIRREVEKHELVCPVIEVSCIGHCYAEPIVTVSACPVGALTFKDSSWRQIGVNIGADSCAVQPVRS